MFEVLQSKQDIEAARLSMRAQGRSVIPERPVQTGVWHKILQRLGWMRPPLLVGDHVKSWDVGRTLEFIAAQLPKDARILDLGAYCSEVPVALARMGYTGVHGVDLNPEVAFMPHAERVRYSVSDFMHTPFEAGSFDAVTSISVIEHGYDPERLLAEVGRLLRPGGYFMASFDYWPEKIDTGETKFFGMSWLIFSAQDVEHMLSVARKHGLVPVGTLNHAARDRAIHCMGFDYTFGWVVLKKEN